MFYFVATLSMLAFAIQNTLLVHYARRMDGLSLAFYRNGSFAITLLPLLYFGDTGSIDAVIAEWKVLLVSAVSGALALWCVFNAYDYLSVGVARSYNRAVTTITLAATSWIVFGEVLSVAALFLLGMIVAAILWLGSLKNEHAHLDAGFVKGVSLIVTASLCISVTKFALAFLSRNLDPLVSAYFWEVSIAVAILILILVRRMFTGQPIAHVGGRTIFMVALCSAPTLIGTGGFALALSMGPVSITEAIGTGSLVVSALMAHFLYGEALHRKQWLCIGLIFLGICGLKFV